MATIMTHAIAGYTIARVCVRKPVPPFYWVLAVLAPALPDLDTLGHKYGIRYQDCFGHRGALHSLLVAAFCALVLIAVFKLFARPRGFSLLKDCFWGLFLGISSHGLLDALTNGGLGVAVFWPWSCQRYFFPVRPLEVSPLSVERFFQQGIFIMKNEFYYVWIPCLAVLFLLYALQRFSMRNRF